MELLEFAADGVGGAGVEAHMTAGAGVRVDGVADQRAAYSGRAAPLDHVSHDLFAEVAQGGEHGVGRAAAQLAQRTLDDVVAELLEQLDVVHRAQALGDALEDLEHPLRADAAGHALAAALLGRELQEELGEVDHAGRVVDDDHAAGAHHGAVPGEVLEVEGGVEQFRREAAAARPAELDGLELVAVPHAAADVEDDLAQRGAHGHLDETGVPHLAGE